MRTGDHSASRSSPRQPGLESAFGGDRLDAAARKIWILRDSARKRQISKVFAAQIPAILRGDGDPKLDSPDEGRPKKGEKKASFTRTKSTFSMKFFDICEFRSASE
jgi:hypothetical protein